MRCRCGPGVVWHKLLGPVIASAGITTGLFVLAGVVVGGLVTGAVNYFLEWGRERANARVAMRLLAAELMLAAASADWRLEQRAWSPWNFESAHRAWNEYRSEFARAVSTDDFESVAVGYAAIELVERRFSNKAVATKLDADELQSLDTASQSIHDGLNALRRRQKLKEIARG
jgi:hypothetical protein